MIEIKEDETHTPTPRDARMKVVQQGDNPESSHTVEIHESEPNLDTILAFGSAKYQTEVTVQDVIDSRAWLFKEVSGQGEAADAARLDYAKEIVDATFPSDKRFRDERARERYEITRGSYIKALTYPDLYFEARKKAWIERNRPASSRPNETENASEQPLSVEVTTATVEQPSTTEDDEYYTAYEAGGYEGDLSSLIAWKEQHGSIEKNEKSESTTKTTEGNLGAVALTANAIQPEGNGEQVAHIQAEAEAIAADATVQPEAQALATPKSTEKASDNEEIKLPSVEELARRDGIAPDRISAKDRAIYEDILRISKGTVMLKTANAGSLLIDRPITRQVSQFDKAKEKISSALKSFKNMLVAGNNKLGISTKARRTATYLKDARGRVKSRTQNVVSAIKQADVKGKIEGFLESTNASMERRVKKVNKFIRPGTTRKNDQNKKFDNHGSE